MGLETRCMQGALATATLALLMVVSVDDEGGIRETVGKRG